jgi:ParB-like chromosome segregation protein Spo0J
VQIEYRPLSEIKPYPQNAGHIPQAAVDAVAKSIQEFGWRQPIIVDKESVTVVGHVRLKAAYQLGLEQAPVHVALETGPVSTSTVRPRRRT